MLLSTLWGDHSFGNCWMRFGVAAGTQWLAPLPDRMWSSIFGPSISKIFAYSGVRSSSVRRLVSNLVRYIELGEIKPVVSGIHPLSRIVFAQQEFLEKRHVGKIVLVPDP